MNPIDAIAHYTAKLPQTGNDSPADAEDRAALDALNAALGEAEGELQLAAQSIGAPDWPTARRLMAAFVVAAGRQSPAAALAQLRADIAHAAEWLREPGTGVAEVFAWLEARTQPTTGDPEPVEDE